MEKKKFIRNTFKILGVVFGIVIGLPLFFITLVYIDPGKSVTMIIMFAICLLLGFLLYRQKAKPWRRIAG